MSMTEAAWVVLIAGVLLIALLGSFAGWVTAVVLRGDQKGLLLDAALHWSATWSSTRPGK
jgi:hypothetical protein